ncbi:polysaccharide deacetylase family protein [Lachnobacterium bovis]|uniref:Peptidoglycan/xylan/chitin deacetylase, PgdA/CDA1 family n=1 Tax=Lachnobacterium bovis TaxID=140626 RepID=A0A1H9S3V5_9FIRM|nr:polysaccharide deacetylase family protein [Lachnobacterium bovis]SER78819.1 Peptidoglycan/xylan/chitin deacetylase, PgdA/CDA1 family [Lachnobacterium bovis]
MLRAKKDTKKSIMVLLIVIVALALLAGIIIAVLGNNKKLSIELNGKANQVVDYASKYKDPGAKATYASKFLPFGKTDVKVKTTGEVDTSKLGKYEVSYEASYDGKKVTKKRSVEVKDISGPKVKLSKGNVVYVLPGQEYTEDGYSATDNLDGDVTNNVKKTVSKRKITYEVSDKRGNTTTEVRKIVYKDKVAPVITLKGGKKVTAYQNIGWKDEYTAIDNLDGNVTNKVKVTGKVNMKKCGTYTLKYTVSDAHNNKATAKRVVKVEKEGTMPQVVPDSKVCYLTFDDGPGPHTNKLLDILKKYNVKATFFVTNLRKDCQADIAREAKEGHAIGVHSFTHDYKKIYASEAAYWADFDAMEEVIKQETGKTTKLMRFPGGSSNLVSKFNHGVMGRLTQQANDKGYVYFDWNVSSGDAGATKDTNVVRQNIIAGMQTHNKAVVLCHDIKDFTVNAIEGVITWGLQNGYTFLPLDESSFPAHHPVLNK